MKKKIRMAALILAVLGLVCLGAGCKAHTHAFGEWEAQSPASCESAGIEVRRCECGEEETREGTPATGHAFVSIAAECLLEKPMATMVIAPIDLHVTGTCVCGAEVEITEGIELAGAALVLGENTLTVSYGELSTMLTIQAEKLDLTLDAVISDDTCVDSGSKDKEGTAKKVLGANADQYRTYFRVNLDKIVGTELFAANRDDAKVRLTLSITGGSIDEETIFTLKAYDPALAEAKADFSKLTWDSVDNNEGAQGEYAALHWNCGTVLVSGGSGYGIQADQEKIIVTLAYSQIEPFVDENGNVLLAFAVNGGKLKVGSLENKTETNRPVIQIVLNDEHFHVFDRETAERKYLVSAKCKEQAVYRKSCACGEAGSETFKHGPALGHTYGKLVPKVERTCTTDGMREHYRCTVCGKYFAEKNGKKVVTNAKSLKIPAGHNCGKLIPRKDATCAENGLEAHYRCDRCKKYFVEVNGERVETTKDALTIPKVGHSYSDLVPKQEKTCTSDGMKSHYRCTVCGKYFVEKDGQKVATSEASLRIPADHKYGKLVPRKEPTCTEEGMEAHYRCDVCKKYFVEVDGRKVEVSREDLKIPKASHSFGDLVPRQEKTCTADGMKAHYRCTVCQKYFVEKDGKKTAVSADSLRIKAGHELTMKWDDTHHWSECTAGCGYRTEPEAHRGGETTETEQALCEVCGHRYGGLKPAAARRSDAFLRK